MTINNDAIDRFVSFFRGRGDVYGSAKGFCVHEKLTRAVFERHLTSLDPDDHIGVYCMLDTNCSWGCVDIDGKDHPLPKNTWGMNEDAPWDWAEMINIARRLQLVLAAKDIHAYIERTKNGYHVWVFPETPLVPARAMRRALMAACKAIGYDPKEVNPKAEGPRKGTKGYGNFVRLPYGGALSGNYSYAQRYFTHNGSPDGVLSIEDFLDTAKRTTTAALENVARLYVPPPEPEHEVDFDAGLEAEPLLDQLGRTEQLIWQYGPMGNADRSGTLVRLAHKMHNAGLSPDIAYAILASADKRWGKYHDQGRPEEVGRIIERVYG